MSRQIPEGWKAGVLTDYAEINPRLAQRSELEEDTLVSFIRMEDVSNNAIVKNVRIVSYEQVSKGFTTFQDKDVLLAKITPCFENGKGGFVDNLQNGVGFGSTEFHVLRAKENSDPHFIYQVTNYPEFRIKGETNMTGSAGQRRVPTDYLKTFDVVFPPLPEQQKIATILTSVDTVIEKTRAQIDKLKHLKTGMMQQLLTQGIGHTEFKDSPVGRIPKAWEVVEFSKLAECKPKKYNPLKELKKLPCIELEHIEQESGRILGYTSSSEVISIKNKFSSEDVLFSKLRPYLKKFAFPKHDGVCTSEIWVFTPRKEVTSLFLFYVVQSETFLAAANKSCGTKMPRAELDAVLETFFTKPPVKEQQKIASILQSVDDKIAAVNQKLASLEKAKKAMMQDLLTGKVRVETTARC